MVASSADIWNVETLSKDKTKDKIYYKWKFHKVTFNDGEWHYHK